MCTVRLFVCLFSCFTTTAYSQDHVRPVSYLNPEILSHQGGAITAFQKNAERRGERGTNTTNAVAARWHRQLTPWEILEREGSAFRLDILKTNAVYGRRMNALRTPWQRGENLSTRHELRWHAVRSYCKRRGSLWRLHRDGTASITMSLHPYRADSALSRRVIYFTVFLWRLLGAVIAFTRRYHGVYCARVELSLTASNSVF